MNGVDSNSSNDEKVRLFRSLFCGRGDVFARRFDNAKTGKKGYSPCCENQWVRGVCSLLRGVKCAECPNRNTLPVSDEVIRWHLRGKDGRLKPFEMVTSRPGAGMRYVWYEKSASWTSLSYWSDQDLEKVLTSGSFSRKASARGWCAPRCPISSP